VIPVYCYMRQVGCLMNLPRKN